MVVNRVLQQQTRVHPMRMETRTVKPFLRAQSLHAADGGSRSSSLDTPASLGAVGSRRITTVLSRG
jgi:hypothetical protein